jgi:protein TonB
MRFFPALIGALAITVAVFLFMQSLIQRNREEVVQIPVYTELQILRQESEPEEPEQEPDRPEEPPPEPTMESLAVKDVAPPSPTPAADLDLPPLDLGIGDIKVQAGGQRWSAPLSADAITTDMGGKDGRGYIEVIPFNTRQPNVPDVAWQNKISGWVLVAFNVNPDGRTANVRVLDANPRGVFEEKVIAAVEDWTYRLSFSGNAARGSVVLTQKIEVRWEDYPSNMPNVD